MTAEAQAIAPADDREIISTEAGKYTNVALLPCFIIALAGLQALL